MIAASEGIISEGRCWLYDFSLKLVASCIKRKFICTAGVLVFLSHLHKHTHTHTNLCLNRHTHTSLSWGSADRMFSLDPATNFTGKNTGTYTYAHTYTNQIDHKQLGWPAQAKEPFHIIYLLFYCTINDAYWFILFHPQFYTC